MRNNTIFKFITLLLVASMLISTCAILASCSKNKTDTPNDTTAENTAPDETQPNETDSSNSGETGVESGDESGEENSQGETEGSESGDISTDGDTEVPTESNSETETETEPETEEYTGDPYTYAEVGEIIISKVYGNDGNVDAPVKASFIELYNTTDKNLSLGQFSLYYGEGKSFSRLKFSEHTIIAPNSYFLIKCNEVDNYAGVELLRVDNFDLEWNIKIDNKEFEIVIAHNDAKVEPSSDFRSNTGISSYLAASLVPNVDIYRVHDLSKNKVIIRNELDKDVGYSLVNLTKSSEYNLKKITPKSMKGNNTYVKSNFVEVEFSREGGVYNTMFQLELSAPEGYTIFYTLNGETPSPMSATKYTGAISIASTDSLRYGSLAKRANGLFGGFNTSSKRTGGVVVKAMAINNKGEKTAVFTQTYFVSPKLVKSDAIIISISLPEDDFIGSKNGAYYTYQFDLWGTRPRSRAFMEVYDKDGVKRGGSYIEFAVSGNGSSGIPMKSLRLYYKDPLDLNDPAPDSLEFNVFGEWSNNILGQNISTFERVLIRNAGNDYGHTYIRDAFVQRLALDTNVDSMAYTPAIVYVNGEIWGVYNLRERYSPEYFNQKYGVLEENVSLIENESPLKYGSSPESWNSDYVATAGDAKYAKEFNELVMYIRNSDLSKDDVYKYVTDRIDVDSFIDYVIFETYFYNNDWPGNNIKVWRNIDPDDPSGMDTKWRFVLLDMDHCLGFSGVNDPASNFFYNFGDNTRCGSVVKGLMENKEFRLKFAIRAFELMETTFKYENALAILNDMAAERRELMDFQYSAWANGGSFASYDSQIDVMRNFIRNRAANYKAQVLSYTGLKESDLIPEGVGYLDVFADNARYYVYINDEQVRSTKKIQFQDSYTFTVKATGRSGYEVFAISFVSNDGSVVERIEGDTATFEITKSGRIVVLARSASQGQQVLSVKSGLTAGMNSVFYLTEGGDLYAWGQNVGGALGLGLADSYVPSYIMSGVARVETTRGFVMDSETENPYSTAVLTTDGILYTVGNNSYGQLGRDGDTSILLPVEFDGVIKDVKMGQDYMLILDSSNQLWGVGNNSRGQLGAENYQKNVTKFQLIAKGVSAFAASRRTTAYITTRGDLYVVGDNRWNKSHTGAASDTLTPVKIASNMKDVVGGAHELIALNNNGDLYYVGWRRFDTFQQGESAADKPNGVLYKVLGNVKEAEILEDHIIMLTNDGKVYGYGINSYGQMANNNASILGTAKLIISGAVDIAAGTGFTSILTSDGKIITYGRNVYGQAGTGSVSGTVNKAQINAPV